MSTNIKILLASLLFITLSASQPTNSEVKVYVFFGSASQNCSGYGICRLYVADGDDMDSVADASGVLRLLGNHLELNINASSISTDVMQKHFHNPTFFLYESYLASSEISQELGVKGFRIPLGEYEYDLDDEELVIYMRAVVPEEE